jgi:hypothetical protein
MASHTPWQIPPGRSRIKSKIGMPFPGGSVKQTKNGGLASEITVSTKNELDRVGLLLRHISNHRQFEHLVLICLEQQNDPEDEPSEAKYQMQWRG